MLGGARVFTANRVIDLLLPQNGLSCYMLSGDFYYMNSNCLIYYFMLLYIGFRSTVDRVINAKV